MLPARGLALLLAALAAATQEGEDAGLASLDHLLLLRVNVGSLPPPECVRDDRLQVAVRLLNPLQAWILDQWQQDSGQSMAF